MTNSSLHNKPSKLGTVTSHRSEMSSTSRFYDNGGDTSSSLSDNSYVENQIINSNTNNNSKTITAKAAYSQVMPPPAPIGFKISSSSSSNTSPTKNNLVIPPPVHQRTSK